MAVHARNKFTENGENMDEYKFRYKRLENLKNDIKAGGYSIPIDEDFSPLTGTVCIAGFTTKNSMAIHPMEGCDADETGSPSPMTLRRYRRYAQGGAGVIWVEATAVSSESRANNHQLWLHEENVDAFRKAVTAIRDSAETGEPYIVLQLTHSGRFSNVGTRVGIGEANPYLDQNQKSYHILSDSELCALEDQFVQAARLAKRAGFHAVDIKACHRYLLSEMLSCYGREGMYGGSLENRARLLVNIVRKIRRKVEIDVAVRLNAFDEIEYPYGFGVNREDCHIPDFTEAKQVAKMLAEAGISLLSVSGATPYYNPHINRPYDRGPYPPPTTQLDSIHKLLAGARELKAAISRIPVLSCGFSWLREYGANVAAAGIRRGDYDLAGFGRQAFAYPDFAEDIRLHNSLDRKKCCITCGKCSELMRVHIMTGCVVRDSEIYGAQYQKTFHTQRER